MAASRKAMLSFDGQSMEMRQPQILDIGVQGIRRAVVAAMGVAEVEEVEMGVAEVAFAIVVILIVQVVGFRTRCPILPICDS
jgi:hypothetical protein